jgi:hypothetical protein
VFGVPAAGSATALLLLRAMLAHVILFGDAAMMVAINQNNSRSRSPPLSISIFLSHHPSAPLFAGEKQQRDHLEGRYQASSLTISIIYTLTL